MSEDEAQVRKVREKHKSEDVGTDVEDYSGEDTTKKSKKMEWLLDSQCDIMGTPHSETFWIISR